MIKKIVNTLLKKHAAHAMGGKTLVCILNYNLKDQTDILYRLLKPYESTDYDVAIIDNGSPPDQRSYMVPAIHYNSLTLKTGKAPISMSTHAERALANMEGYFKKIGQEKTLKSFRRFGKTYKV